MKPESIKELFFRVVKRARKKYDFSIENICLMGNHYHMIIRPAPNVSLSRIMQWIMSVFAMAFNRRKGFIGHVWGGRFLSWVIHGFKQFCRIFRYIDENPVRAKLVEFSWEWKYGGINLHRSDHQDPLLENLEWIRLIFPKHGLLALPRP